MRDQRTMFSHRWYGVTAVLVTAFFALVGVATAHGVKAQDPSISQGFTTKSTDLQPGALVSSDEQSKTEVKLSDTDSAAGLVGVVADKALLEIDPSGQKIQVVTSGVASTLASDINGEIKKGDHITASPIAGVGMKTRGGTQVVGVALEDMNFQNASERTIQDRDGNSQTIRVGHVNVLVNVVYYPLPDDQKTIIPGFMQQFASTIAGKQVSTSRIVVALLIVLIGMFGAAILLNSSVRSSIISIGRNPLSERAVRKSLIGVLATCVGIIGVTFGVVYLVLRI